MIPPRATLISTAEFFIFLNVSALNKSLFPSAGQCKEIISDFVIISSTETAVTYSSVSGVALKYGSVPITLKPSACIFFAKLRPILPSPTTPTVSSLNLWIGIAFV